MNDSSPKPRRRFLLFSVRAMLLLVTVIAVVALVGIRKVREQGIAVATLEKLGCQIWYDRSSRPPTFEERLRSLCGETKSRNVVGVVAVAGNQQMTDASMCHIKDLSHLHFLTLAEVPVTDSGMLQLQGMTELTNLDLEYTHVTDAGLVNLRGMTQLTSIAIEGTKVSDAGLGHLRRLTKLKKLYLNGTLVTADGVQQLRKALPKCEIVR